MEVYDYEKASSSEDTRLYLLNPRSNELYLANMQLPEMTGIEEFVVVQTLQLQTMTEFVARTKGKTREDLRPFRLQKDPQNVLRIGYELDSPSVTDQGFTNMYTLGVVVYPANFGDVLIILALKLEEMAEKRLEEVSETQIEE